MICHPNLIRMQTSGEVKIIGHWALGECQGIQIPSNLSFACEQRSCNKHILDWWQTLSHYDKHYDKVSCALAIRICVAVAVPVVNTYGIIHCTSSHWLLGQSVSHMLSRLVEFVGSGGQGAAWCTKGCLCFLIYLSQTVSQAFHSLINWVCNNCPFCIR